MIRIKETTKLKLKEWLKLPLLLFIIFSVEYSVLYIVTRAEFLPFLQIINSDYGNILMFLTSTVMTGATVIYAYFAYKQYVSDKDERETKERPLIFPIITDTYGSLQFDYRVPNLIPIKTQRLDVNLSLKNIGKSTSTGVLIKASINHKTPRNKITIPLTNDDYYIGVILPDNEEHIIISIYEQDLKRLLEILTKRFQLSHHFVKKEYGDLAYPTFDMEIIYTNIEDRWFCSKLVSQIYWIEDMSHTSLSKDKLFDNTIPPCPLDRNATFKLRIADSYHSVFTTYPLSNKSVEKMMADLKDNRMIESTLYLKKNPKIQKMILQTVPIDDGEREMIMGGLCRKKNE